LTKGEEHKESRERVGGYLLLTFRWPQAAEASRGNLNPRNGLDSTIVKKEGAQSKKICIRIALVKQGAVKR